MASTTQSRKEKRRQERLMRELKRLGPLYKGDETYPLSDAEIQEYNNRFFIRGNVSEDDAKKMSRGIASTLSYPAGIKRARESLETGATYHVSIGATNMDERGQTIDTLPWNDERINIAPKILSESPESVGSIITHEAIHDEENWFESHFGEKVASDAPTWAYETQLASDIYNSTGKRLETLNPVYHNDFMNEYNKCLAHAKDPQNTDRPDGATRFKPRDGLSPEIYEIAQKRWAYENASNIMREKFEKTFTTELEDWRPAEHIMSTDIAFQREMYAAQDDASDEEKAAFKNRNNISNIRNCVQSEVERLGKDNPLSGAMNSALSKLENKKSLTDKDLAVLNYATAATPGLNKHHKNGLSVLAGQVYDIGLSEKQKANDPVRDALQTEIQQRTENPYITPTYQQEQDMKAGKELKVAQNETTTPENAETKGSATRALANAGQNITEQQVENPNQMQQDITRDV